jgi:hypothetical protein
MYNMEISIGSYKFRLEIIIAIIIVFWIMFGHLLCRCSRVTMYEGMQIMKEKMTSGSKPKTSIAMTNMLDANAKATTVEGFTGANNSASGPEFAGAKTPDYIMNPSTWSMPTLTYSPGTRPDAGVQAIWNRPKQPIPLPKDELDMFATTEFKPECCPNAYSSSTGCACMTVEQLNYLNSRGSNNVPYSEY